MDSEKEGGKQERRHELSIFWNDQGKSLQILQSLQGQQMDTMNNFIHINMTTQMK